MIADVLVGVLLVATAVTGTAVALTRHPTRQALVLSAYGLVLGVLMVVLQAPDVALAQIGIGTAVVPLLVVLTVAKVDRELSTRKDESDAGSSEDAGTEAAKERDR
jgi:energy-converting hydrogenase B subunit D